MYFEYGEKEISYLKGKDQKLKEVIEQIGPIKRTVDTDLFSSIVYHIIGQQISTKAQETIWRRTLERVGEVNAENICRMDIEQLQSLGISFRKAEYIEDFAKNVSDGSFDLENIRNLSDEDAIRSLSSLRGSASGQRKCFFCSVCRDRMYSVMMIWRSGAGFGWYITTARLTGNYLKNTAADLHRIAAWQVCIFGRYREARSRGCGIMHRPKAKENTRGRYNVNHIQNK